MSSYSFLSLISQSFLWELTTAWGYIVSSGIGLPNPCSIKCQIQMRSTNTRDLPTQPHSLSSGGWIAEYGVDYESRWLQAVPYTMFFLFRYYVVCSVYVEDIEVYAVFRLLISAARSEQHPSSTPPHLLNTRKTAKVSPSSSFTAIPPQRRKRIEKRHVTAICLIQLEACHGWAACESCFVLFPITLYLQCLGALYRSMGKKINVQHINDK